MMIRRRRNEEEDIGGWVALTYKEATLSLNGCGSWRTNTITTTTKTGNEGRRDGR